MCIILTCESGVRPDYRLVDDCFYQNPDGAGIMWVSDGKVVLAKGYTDPLSLMDAIEDVPLDSPLVIHMRIATSGGVSLGTCHPFPITRNINELHAPDAECDAAIAHNGIIRGMPTDEDAGISDTVSFVMRLAEHWHGKASKGIRKRIRRDAPGNRFAILTKDGTVTRIGDGWETVVDGIKASNWTWSFGTYYNELMAELGYYGDAEDKKEQYVPRICKGCCDYAVCKKYGDFPCFPANDDWYEYDKYEFDEYGLIV